MKKMKLLSHRLDWHRFWYRFWRFRSKDIAKYHDMKIDRLVSKVLTEVSIDEKGD
jgi:hypothetical protein